ncbi:MAG: head morphoproteinis protein SPP1 [Bacteroidetes bacterium]|nr:MAG: head morphoproteinis protein SPP1 [Bacteroidota bacterium]
MSKRKRANLKQQAPIPTVKKRTEGYVNSIAPKATAITRQDIAKWTAARRQAENVDNPKRILLQKLYKDIRLDALLTSLIEGRKMISQSAPFKIFSGDTEDEATTALLKSLPWVQTMNGEIFETRLSGTALIEFVTDKLGNLKPVLIPKTNVIPEKGILLFDETSTQGVDFRNAKEYGSWLIEIGEINDFGLLNKAVPHVLFKRFAQSCWSELCEIYGIPPRFIKTNTQDPVMLQRAETMMRDMGAAAWFVIDDTEEFEFAKGADTNGDVYNNLIRLCNNENSMLLHGAVIGQDTKNGNESKEKVSIGQLMQLADSDKRYIEGYWNTVILPALFKIGFLPDGLRYEYDPQEDTGELYTRTIGFLQFMDVDPEWVKQKFGIEVTGIKVTAAPGGTGNFQKAPKD